MNKCIKASAVILLLYGLIEIWDTISALLMTLGIISNPYPEMYFEPVNTLITQKPEYLLVLFACITLLRISSGVLILMNRKAGLYVAFGITTITFAYVPFFLPLGVFDFLIGSVLTILLATGLNKKETIYKKEGKND
ncbi:MAG: hypothetical protein PQJ46_15470 [Spirochaetales bacterium]|nr:hypothetical protein [Spirochaetales bacterium]